MASFSKQHLGVDEPGEWLDAAETAFLRERNEVKILTAAGMPDPRFPLFTLDEIDAHFAERVAEASRLAAMSLFGAAEAGLRIDFENRASRKVKKRIGSALNADFRALRKSHKERVRLDDILGAWATNEPNVKSSVSSFGKSLHTRHWLAHGRYWLSKQSSIGFRALGPIVATMVAEMEASSSKFFPNPL